MKIWASQMDREPQGPKIGPLEPLQDPILAYLGTWGQFGVKKRANLGSKKLYGGD